MCFERGDSKYSEDLFGKPELVVFHLSPIYCKESEERRSGPDESITIIYSNIVALCVKKLIELEGTSSRTRAYNIKSILHRYKAHSGCNIESLYLPRFPPLRLKNICFYLERVRWNVVTNYDVQRMNGLWKALKSTLKQNICWSHLEVLQIFLVAHAHKFLS